MSYTDESGGRKYFNEEEVKYLRLNRNVERVSRSTVKFTEEFKKRFYQQWKLGKTARQLFTENGIDPDVLGIKRIAGFCYNLNKQAKREEGFTDQREHNYQRPAKTGDETVEVRFKRLEHELAYTRQEVEFLKKLQAADMEARKQWESKHRPK
jgi:transposase